MQVAVAVVGGAPEGAARLVDVGTEAVTAEVGPALHLPGASTDLTELFVRALNVPRQAVSVGRGPAGKPGSRVVLVRGLEPGAVFERLSEAARIGSGPAKGGGNDGSADTARAKSVPRDEARAI